MNDQIIEQMKKYNICIGKEAHPIELNIPYRTKDGRKAFRKTIDTLANLFSLSQTKSILGLLLLSPKECNIELINNIPQVFTPIDLIEPRSNWRVPYEVIVVTEDEKMYSELKSKKIPCQILYSEYDVQGLERYDLVRVIKCEKYNSALEDLHQSEFFKSIEHIYPEENLLVLNKWKDNLNKNNLDIFPELNNQIKKILEINLDSDLEILSLEDIEIKIDQVNKTISKKLEEMTFSGEELIKVANNTLPNKLKLIIREELDLHKIKPNLVFEKIPLEIDQEELEKEIKLSEINSSIDFYKKIKQDEEIIKRIPEIINEFRTKIIIADFYNGINKFKELNFNPIKEGNLNIDKSNNMFLKEAQAISYNLDRHKATILTGANSGGKTTLLEHILQLTVLANLGLPNSGIVSIPSYDNIYYFAKTKGSLNKGAFETLLTQLSKVDHSGKTLILADELEAVTEPGIAAKIIATTVDYYLDKGCELVFASHLGKEIVEHLGERVRVDGIEAKGLDENNDVIIDHNPVIGKLAKSTPELIVEKMALKQNNDFFKCLNNKLKSQESG